MLVSGAPLGEIAVAESPGLFESAGSHQRVPLAHVEWRMPRLGVAADLLRAELGESAVLSRRTRVVGTNAFRLRCETERQRDIERLERGHLPVEPTLRVRPEAVRPAQSRADVPHAQLAQ